MRVSPPSSEVLLTYWQSPDRAAKAFFCQREAMETAICLTEVAGHSQPWIEARLREENEDKNPGLYRVAFKIATGSARPRSRRCSSLGRRSTSSPTRHIDGGGPSPLNLSVEVTGERKPAKDDKVATARDFWVPAINKQRSLRRWLLLEVTDPLAPAT